MKKLIMALIIVSLTACTGEIEYSKDERTGLCFAHQASVTNNGSIVDSITNVPCEKVEGLITK